MGSIMSTVYLGLTYCCCNAAGSLCQSCLGSTAAGTTGRKRSVLLLSMAIALALWFQYQVGPSIVQERGWVWRVYRTIPGSGRMVYHSWKDSYCGELYQDQQQDEELLTQCAGNAGVYRPTAVAALFFALSAVGTKMVPSMNREAWLAKYVLFLFGVLFSMFLPNAPIFTGIFLWLARLCAAIFVVIQQVILIDIAYNWNDDWVEKSNECDRLSYGSGDKWLRAIVATCVALYTLAVLGIALLYQFFTGCPENTAVITLTLVGIVAMTATQLSGTEGSLLTSSVMSLYVTYLAFSIVSKNPNGACNPHLGHNDVMGIVIGLTLTALSLAWTGWSWSAEQRLNVDSAQAPRSMQAQPSTPRNPRTMNLDVPFLDPEEQPPAGLVMEPAMTMSSRGAAGAAAAGSDLWKLNVVLALISCWTAMTLTGWGSMEGSSDNDESREHHNAANPTVGRVNMTMIGISQWLAILLYMWTLLAPRLFPDRDFSY